jgi:integrating conjugative element relaxase (TIGR03760 family)
MAVTGKALSEKALKSLRALFQPSAEAPPAAPPPPETPTGCFAPRTAHDLLSTPRRQRLLEHIWQRTSLSRSQFDALYRAPIERYAELVQEMPASESHHHAWPGGMLDHGLEIVAYALKMRQSRLLPVGSPPEEQAAQSEAWTAAVAYAALAHDIGKVAVDLHVETAEGEVWHPWHGPLTEPYRFRFVEGREYRLHGAATGLLYTRLLAPGILDWLSGYPQLWSALLYVLAGQYDRAGVLGEIVMQADQASVASSLGGDPAKAIAAPKHALQRKLLDGLRYLVREEFKLNQPQASDGWLTEDALWLVCKTVADKLRAHLLSQGFDGIPSNNKVVFDVLQEHGIVQPAPDGKAIWRAKVTSGAGWTFDLTFLRVSPALIWTLDERPEPYSGHVRILNDVVASTPADALKPENRNHFVLLPADDTMGSHEVSKSVIDESGMPAAFNLLAADAGELEDPAPSERAVEMGTPVGPDEVGAHFVDWLRDGLAQFRLSYNNTKALVHVVDNTAMIVTPTIFMRYANENRWVKAFAKDADQVDWRWVQRQFLILGLHRRMNDGLHICSCQVYGPKNPGGKLNGHLFLDPKTIFSKVPSNNPFLRLEQSAAPPATSSVSKTRTRRR